MLFIKTEQDKFEAAECLTEDNGMTWMTEKGHYLSVDFCNEFKIPCDCSKQQKAYLTQSLINIS